MTSSIERVYVLTELGKKAGQGISPGNRDELIDYIYSNKTARLSELSGLLGIKEGEVKSKMRPYIRRGLVQELTH